MASSLASTSNATAELDVDRLLALEDTMVNRELEVERVLRCFKLNPYEILDLDMTPGSVQLEDVRRSYVGFISPALCDCA